MKHFERLANQILSLEASASGFLKSELAPTETRHARMFVATHGDIRHYLYSPKAGCNYGCSLLFGVEIRECREPLHAALANLGLSAPLIYPVIAVDIRPCFLLRSGMQHLFKNFYFYPDNLDEYKSIARLIIDQFYFRNYSKVLTLESFMTHMLRQEGQFRWYGLDALYSCAQVVYCWHKLNLSEHGLMDIIGDRIMTLEPYQKLIATQDPFPLALLKQLSRVT
jgi:hypothetical protein